MARPKIKPNIDPEQLKSNPFTYSPDFVIKTRNVTSKTDFVDVNSIIDGVITSPPTPHISRFIVEDEPFCKVYAT